MPLDECMRKHTHRQYIMWMRYLEGEWNQPSRTDFYLMQVAAKVDGMFRKGSPTTDNYKMKLSRQAAPKPLTQAEIIRHSKARAKAAVGYKD